MHRATTENILINMGMPISIKGFKYIVDTVELLDKPEWKNPKWTAIYHAVGSINNDTDSCVEKSIRSALKTVRDKGKYSKVDHYIGYDNTSNSNSLYMLYLNAKKEDNIIDITEIRNILYSLMDALNIEQRCD